MADAEAGAGGRGDVGIQHAVEGAAFVFFAVNEGFAALVVGDDASAQVTGGGERLAVVGAEFEVAVAADACFQRGFAFAAVGVFAHEIDAG